MPAIPPLREHRISIGEILAVVVEALAYAVAGRRRDLGRALAVSGIGNALRYELVGPLASLLWL